MEFDTTRSDHMHQKGSVPIYAALWDKFLTSSGNVPSESLGASNCLGKDIAEWRWEAVGLPMLRANVIEKLQVTS